LCEEGYDLYFYDQIGSGHSQRLKDIGEYSVQRHRADLKEIVALIGADKVILLGHSWGACLAINYLEQFPADVAKIILTGLGPILPVNEALAKEKAPASLELIAPQYSNKEGNLIANNWRSRLTLKWAYRFNLKLAADKEADDFFTFLNQELSKSTDCVLKEEGKQEGGGGYYSHIMTVSSFDEVPDNRSVLQEMKVPILIFRG